MSKTIPVISSLSSIRIIESEGRFLLELYSYCTGKANYFLNLIHRLIVLYCSFIGLIETSRSCAHISVPNPIPLLTCQNQAIKSRFLRQSQNSLMMIRYHSACYSLRSQTLSRQASVQTLKSNQCIPIRSKLYWGHAINEWIQFLEIGAQDVKTKTEIFGLLLNEILQ